MKFKCVFFTFLFFITSLFFLREDVVLFYLKGNISNFFPGEVSFKEVKWREGTLYFEQFSFSNESGNVQIPMFTIKCREFSWNRLCFDLEINDAEVELLSSQLSLKHDKKKLFSFFDIHISSVVSHAIIRQQEKNLFFEVNIDKDRKGDLYFINEKNKILFYPDRTVLGSYKLELNKAPLSEIVRLANTFGWEYPVLGDVVNGVVTGNGLLSIKNNFFSVVQSNLTICDLKVLGTKKECFFEGKELSVVLESSAPSNEKKMIIKCVKEGVISLFDTVFIEDIQGMMTYSNEGISYRIVGKNAQKKQRIGLEGNKGEQGWNLALNFEKYNSSLGRLALAGGELEGQKYKIKGKAKDLQLDSLSVIQKVVENVIDKKFDVNLKQGVFSGEFAVELSNETVELFSFKECHCEKGEIWIGDRLGVEFNHFYSSGVFRKKLTFLQSIKELDWSLSEGNFYVEKRLELLHTNSIGEVKEGKVSVATLQSMIKEGHINWVWKGNEINKLTFEGKGKDISDFLPDLMKDLFYQNYAEDVVEIKLQTRFFSNSIDMSGSLEVENKEKVAFGFDLYSSNKMKLNSWFRALQTKEHYDPIERKSFFGYSIVNGWVDTSYFPLDIWFSPFLKKNKRLEIEGLGKVKGYFDDIGLLFNFTGKKLEIDGIDYHISLPSLGDKKNAEELPSVYCSFQTPSFIGLIPVKEASFYSKSKSLLFEDISTLLQLNSRELFTHNIRARSSNMELEGQIHVDYSNLKNVSLNIEIDEVCGTLEEAQNFLEHFNPSIFGRFPIKGDLFLKKKNSYWNVVFQPGSFSQEGYVEGEFRKGSLFLEPFSSSLDEVSIDFSYDTKTHTLITSEGKGKLTVGEEDHYFVRIPLLYFSQTEEPIIHFDFIVEDTLQDLIRLKGMAYPMHESLGDVFFDFDSESTFIGQIKPNIKILRLNNWNRLLYAELNPELDLETLPYDFDRFSKMFFGNNIRKWLTGYERLSSTGKLFGHLLFDQKSDFFHFSLKGNHLKLLNKKVSDFFVQGSCVDQEWHIDQCNFDDLKLKGEWCVKDTFWEVDHISLNHKESSRFLLGGKIFPEKRHFIVEKGTIQLDLDLLSKEFPFLFDLKGVIEAEGSGYVIIPNQDSIEWVYGSSLDISYEKLKIKHLELGAAKNIECQFNSDNGLTIKNFETEIVSIADQPIGTGFVVEEVHYMLFDSEWVVKGIRFSVPASKLLNILQSLLKETNLNIDNRLIQSICKNQKEGDFTGVVTISYGVEGLIVKLDMKNGNYLLGDIEHTLKDIQLIWNPGGLQLKAMYCFPGKSVPLYFRTFNYDLKGGELVFEESPMNKLVIQWELIEKDRLTIRHISGELAGLSVRLFRDEEFFLLGKTLLKGHIGMDVSLLLPYLDETIARKIKKLGLGEGFEISGEWELFNENETNIKSWSFLGTIEGKECQIGNYYMSSCLANLYLNSNHIKITDLEVSDLGGLLEIPLIEIVQDIDSKWNLNIPQIHIEQLRPSLLRKFKNMELKPRSMVVESLDISDVNGKLEDENTLSGNGVFNFSNRTRTGYHSIFTLPTDILTRLGLDLGLFIPVTGKVYFNIQNGKIVFKDFQEVYSHEKGSQFYLENSGDISFMDFDGLLNLQLKIKQYNLLLKLAELFTIYVRGDIGKPIYTVQKQAYRGTKV